MAIAPAVAEALVELERAFPDHAIQSRADSQGGVWVIVEDMPLGSAFVPAVSWIGFAISALYPRADVYPHYVCPQLLRADGGLLSPPLNAGQVMPGFERAAVMVSRRSNRWDPARDTAALKLHRVLLWFDEQSTRHEVAA